MRFSKFAALIILFVLSFGCDSSNKIVDDGHKEPMAEIEIAWFVVEGDLKGFILPLENYILSSRDSDIKTPSFEARIHEIGKITSKKLGVHVFKKGNEKVLGAIKSVAVTLHCHEPVSFLPYSVLLQSELKFDDNYIGIEFESRLEIVGTICDPLKSQGYSIEFYDAVKEPVLHLWTEIKPGIANDDSPDADLHRFINYSSLPKDTKYCLLDWLNVEEARVRQDWVDQCYRHNGRDPHAPIFYTSLRKKAGGKRNLKLPLNVEISCEFADEWEPVAACSPHTESVGLDFEKMHLEGPGLEDVRDANHFVALDLNARMMVEVPKPEFGAALTWGMRRGWVSRKDQREARNELQRCNDTLESQKLDFLSKYLELAYTPVLHAGADLSRCVDSNFEAFLRPVWPYKEVFPADLLRPEQVAGRNEWFAMCFPGEAKDEETCDGEPGTYRLARHKYMFTWKAPTVADPSIECDHWEPVRFCAKAQTSPEFDYSDTPLCEISRTWDLKRHLGPDKKLALFRNDRKVPFCRQGTCNGFSYCHEEMEDWAVHSGHHLPENYKVEKGHWDPNPTEKFRLAHTLLEVRSDWGHLEWSSADILVELQDEIWVGYEWDASLFEAKKNDMKLDLIFDEPSCILNNVESARLEFFCDTVIPIAAKSVERKSKTLSLKFDFLFPPECEPFGGPDHVLLLLFDGNNEKIVHLHLEDPVQGSRLRDIYATSALKEMAD